MKKLLLGFMTLALLLTVCQGCSDDEERVTFLVGFEGMLTEENSEFTTTEGVDVGYGCKKTSFKDPNDMLEFTHYYYDSGFAAGFTYTNKTDKTTPGYTNNSAITGTGYKGSTYLTSYIDSYNPARVTILKPEKYVFGHIMITNSTYAYLALKEGKDNFMNDTKFEDGDWFKLTATGYKGEDTVTGQAEYYLADYRDGKRIAISSWERLNLEALGDAEYIAFTMSSSDNSEKGMDTPAYFCIGEIALLEK